jgi:hypothetical protein
MQCLFKVVGVFDAVFVHFTERYLEVSQNHEKLSFKGASFSVM